MIGMDEVTGKLIRGETWLRQAVRRAVQTPKGSKPMARWYGTNHLRHLAQEITKSSLLELTSDLADSIERTIPGSRLETVMDQTNGEELLVSLALGLEKRKIGV